MLPYDITSSYLKKQYIVDYMKKLQARKLQYYPQKLLQLGHKTMMEQVRYLGGGAAENLWVLRWG